jgi:transposase
MHAPLDTLSSTFIKTTCKGQAWVGSKHIFAGISWWHVKQVEQGSMDMTQSMKHQVEGPIMQEKEWTRAFRRCNSWSTRARKSWRQNDRAGGKRSPGEARGHPGRSASPIKRASRLRLLQASFPLLPQFVCSSLCAQNLRRYSQPSQV